MVGTISCIWKSVLCVMENATTAVWTETRLQQRCVDFTPERLEEQSFDRCEAAQQFFLNSALDGYTEVHIDDLHGTGPKPAIDTDLSRMIRFKVWTVNEVGMEYEHLKRERVLHNDRTEIAPYPKFLRVVLHSMGLTNCRPAPTLIIAGPVKQKP